jgi:subtilisin family serine protease
MNAMLGVVPAGTQIALVALAFLSCALPSAAESGLIALTPPPEPAVTPEIVRPVELDADGSGIDDRLETRLFELKSKLASETDPDRRFALRADMDEPVNVELIFSRRVTQKQIDDFLALGGKIEYIYKSVSYGWNGTIPLKLIDSLRERMGSSLIAVVGDYVVRATLDEATRCGRVRPIWVPGFAGTIGLAGSASTTIAIVDSGLDESHADLSGRQEYWKDWTAGNSANPNDYHGHGTHVAGIALGTGGSAGAPAGTLYYTDQGNLTGVSAGSFYSHPVHIPNGVSTTFTSVASWSGGGTTSLYQVHRSNGSTSSWSALSAAATGTSPLTEANSFTGTSVQFSTALQQNAALTLGPYCIRNSVTNYPAIDDGYNKFRGVAPVCRWAGLKVLGTNGSGTGMDIREGVDDLVTQRLAHGIKVANISIGIDGSPGLDSTLRAKVNTAANNGIVVVVAAGNDGPGTAAANQIDDPGRAAKAITVAASNDVNQLTSYTSSGFSSPGSDEDYKPDVMAPGGSYYYSTIMSLDSNDGDQQNTFTDQQPNDYRGMAGTSMAAPFVAGCAALVIQALEQAGLSWDFYSSSTSLLVKMLLCASATESNAPREASTGTNPTLGRAAGPKDLYEGYGMVNPDAAVEAVLLSYESGVLSGSTTGDVFDRRAWGRNVSLTAGVPVVLNLAVPASADFDLYLYSGTPDAKGNPVILASSCAAAPDADESINYTPSNNGTGYLMIKRVSGSGTWTLTGPADYDPPVPGTAVSPQYAISQPILVSYSGAYDVGSSGLKNVELWFKKGAGGAWTNSGLTSSTGSGSFSFSGATGDDLYYFDLVAEDYAGNRSSAASGGGDCLTVYDTTPPTVPGMVTAGAAYTGSTSVTFTWNASADAGSGVAGYECQIGTSPGSGDVYDGPAGLSKTITGSIGQAYFCRVRASDNAGLVSLWAGDENGITVVENPDISISQAKLLPLVPAAQSVGICGKIVSGAFSDGPNSFIYIQEPDRSSGIRVDLKSQVWLPVGEVCQVGGTLDVSPDGEKRIINATIFGEGGASISPLFMTNRSLGGGDWNWNPTTRTGQMGVSGGVGLSNIGLLVRVSGTVVSIEEPRHVYYIYDGSFDGVVKVIDNTWPFVSVGDYVTISGVSSCYYIDVSQGIVGRLIRVPTPGV